MSKSEKNFAVTAINVGETCNGHATLLGVFESYDVARQFVHDDMMDTYYCMGVDDDSIFDESKLEVWEDKNMNRGCIWDILDLSKPEE